LNKKEKKKKGKRKEYIIKIIKITYSPPERISGAQYPLYKKEKEKIIKITFFLKK
jgi:hypothetical protein